MAHTFHPAKFNPAVCLECGLTEADGHHGLSQTAKLALAGADFTQPTTPKPRRVVAITSVSYRDGSPDVGFNVVILHAVCDDNTVWESYGGGDWHQIRPIPEN